MATRKSEWLASIKPILDRDEAKRDAKELAKELGNLLEIDIDTSPESLKKLTDEFNKQLSQMGKQPIVFSEKTLHGIVNQFANAVAEGFSKGANVGLEETFKLQLANLKKQKEALLKEQDDINRRLSNRSRIEKINNFSIESAHGLPIDKDVVKQAEKMLDEMYEYADRISELQEEQGKESAEYISTVLDAQEAYNKFLRMQKSLKKTKPALPKDLKAAYDLFEGDDEDRYRSAGGKTIAFDYDKYGGEIILDAFEEVSDVLIDTDDQLNDIQKRLKEIDLQIESIVAQAKAAGAVDDTILGDSKDGLKTLKEIEAAYDRIAKKNKKTGGKALDGVSAAVDYVPGSESLTTLRNRYNTSLSSNEDWETQYQWLVKFVKEYENYSEQIEAETDSIKRKNMKARQKQYTALYEELKPMAENAETMLRGIIDVSGGKQPAGVKDANTQDGGMGPTQEDVANAEQIAALERQTREEAEVKAKAEAEAAEAAKQKRIEEEKAAKAAEKKRIADEAAAEAQRKVTEADKTKTYTGYRAIEPPESSGKTKYDALTDWGGEYFSTDKKVAASYGENFFKEGNIIIGEITPKNPLVINANGLRWDEFDKMPNLKELFPGLLDLMKQPGYIGDDGQKYINEQARLAGYDVVVLENVQDALDGDIKEYNLSTTIAVLDDKIVSLTGSLAQLEAGTNRFADVISSEIPSYYARSTDDKGNVVGGGTGDASSAELEAERAKREALQDEIEQKNQEIVQIQQESDAKLKAVSDAKETLQNDLDTTRQQLADSEYEKGLYDSAMHQIEEESDAKDRIIYELREQLANIKTGVGEEQASVSSEELKNVLSSIVYNVKIAHDDSDKTANKITLDESTLENTLKRVFAKELNPQIEQTDPESQNEPWALEKTLLNVKEVLGQIQANTAKPDSIEVAPAKTDVGNVLATENTLAAIKIAVESINTKVVKGTKAKTSENGGGKKAGVGKKNSESYAGSQYFPEKLKTQTMQLAKFRAQLMTTGKLTDDVDAQIYELLDGLKQVQNGPDFSTWSQKFQQLKTSVGITDIFDKAEDKDIIASYKQLVAFQKERNKLELQYEKAQDGSALKQFYAEQLTQMNSVIAKQEEILENEEYEAKLAKIREEQARKLGEAEAKAADKVAKKAAADQKKLDKRRAMTGKAGSAIGRAEGVWLEAEGLEQAKLPDGFKKQVSEYYDALDKLRLKHHEINTSEVVTDEQQAELIRQTKEVNDLTNAIGPLVAEYQKLSGDNVDEANSRATTLTGASSLNDYEAQLKQYVKSITDGKGQIKSFNAETKTLTYTVKTGKNEFTEYTAAVRHLDSQMVAVQGTTKRTETFFEATTRKMRELTSYFSGMAVFNFAKQELRRGIQYIREIDLALTELKKVTDETEETYDRFLETAAKTADKVGSTIQKVVSSTADWARLGYSMKEAAEFAESTQILMNVSEFTDVSQATDTLISAVQAFGYTADTSMEVVDLLNTIGKQNCRNYIVIYG